MRTQSQAQPSENRTVTWLPRNRKTWPVLPDVPETGAPEIVRARTLESRWRASPMKEVGFVWIFDAQR